MKQTKYLTSILITVLLLNAQALFSQTFQNTFLPPSDDNYVAGSAVSANYYVLGNTTYPVSGSVTEKILFSAYNSAGASIMDNLYHNKNRLGYIHTATDIQAGYTTYISSLSQSPSTPPCDIQTVNCPGTAPLAIDMLDPDSKKYFYGTGFYKRNPSDKRKLLIFKLSTSGAVLWSRASYILSPNNEDEAGVSVESCPNRDVFVVSQTTESATGLVYPTITRLDSNGNVKWRFNYKPSPDEAPYKFTPHQSCIFKEYIQNGVHDPIGITVVGELSMPGAAGTMVCVMRVGYDGTMRWKYFYPIFPTPLPYQSGWDIMTEDNSLGISASIAENFVLTGMISSAPTPVPGTDCLVMRVTTASGTFVSGKIITVGSPGHWIYGQGIYQAHSPRSNVVVTGGVFDDELGVLNDTYLTKIDPATGAVAWLNNYPITTPNFPRTESVVSVGKRYPTIGYFLSTNAYDTYGTGTITDAHVIKTDAAGAVNSVDCHNWKIQPKVAEFNSQFIQLCNLLVCDSITKNNLNKVAITVPHVLCYSPTRMEDNGEFMDESAFAINVFPNPVQDKLNITMFTEEDKDARIEIIGMDGKLLIKENIFLSEGSNNHVFNTESLPVGMYFVRVVTTDEIGISRFIKQ